MPLEPTAAARSRVYGVEVKPTREPAVTRCLPVEGETVNKSVQAGVQDSKLYRGSGFNPRTVKDRGVTTLPAPNWSGRVRVELFTGTSQTIEAGDCPRTTSGEIRSPQMKKVGNILFQKNDAVQGWFIKACTP